jgi:hypothetical protein
MRCKLLVGLLLQGLVDRQAAWHERQMKTAMTKRSGSASLDGRHAALLTARYGARERLTSARTRSTTRTRLNLMTSCPRSVEGSMASVTVSRVQHRDHQATSHQATSPRVPR